MLEACSGVSGSGEYKGPRWPQALNINKETPINAAIFMKRISKIQNKYNWPNHALSALKKQPFSGKMSLYFNFI